MDPLDFRLNSDRSSELLARLATTPPATTADVPQSSQQESALYSLLHREPESPNGSASISAPSVVPEQRALDGTAIKAETHFAESNVPLLVEFSTSDSIKTTAIEGRTNLPDGTRLFVGLSAPPLPNGEPMCRNAMWQYEVAVSDGAFKAGPFPCRLGFYTLTLSTPAAEFQPENVQAVIGLHGENLEGPYVEADCARSCPKRMPALGRSIY